jgi:hypothetical protein
MLIKLCLLVLSLISLALIIAFRTTANQRKPFVYKMPNMDD